MYFLALSLLVTGLNARAADQATKEAAFKQEVTVEAADAEKPEEKKAIDPFIGRGGVDQQIGRAHV